MVCLYKEEYVCMVLLLPIFAISTVWLWFIKWDLNQDLSTTLTAQISNLNNKIWWFGITRAFERSWNITTAFRWLSSTSNIIYIKVCEAVSVDLHPMHPFFSSVRILFLCTKEINLLKLSFSNILEKIDKTLMNL